jgi:putative hydrolase of the HAD superfamily
MTEIIGISGKMGSGKDYVAKNVILQLLPPKRTMIIGFADFLKVESIGKDKLSYERVFIKKDLESRKILQRRGTEEGRDRYGMDVWIVIMGAFIKLHSERGIERFIIDDVRFPNELQYIKSIGGIVIRLIAPTRTWNRLMEESSGDATVALQLSKHISETALDSDEYAEQFDHVLFNDPDDSNNVIDYIKTLVPSFVRRVHLTIIMDLDDTICECNMYYDDAVNKVKKMVHTLYEQKYGKFPILDNLLENAVKLRVNTYHERPYRFDGFAHDLLNVVKDVVPGEDQTSEFMSTVYTIGIGVYQNAYTPIGNSLEVVDKIASLGRLVIYTLGDRTEQMRKLVRLGLTKYPIEIFPHKDVNMFLYLKSKYPAERYMVIGDSLERDISPARQARISDTVHITKGLPLDSRIQYELIQNYATNTTHIYGRC